MTKLLYGALSVAVAVGLGCAITEYPIITDNDQTSTGQGSGVVNTNGKAKLFPSPFGIVVTNWADGTDQLFSHIDQKSDGTATITTYNNYSAGGEVPFLDDMYCNPDWNGCSIFTAPDNNDASIFDGTLNANCSGARSLSLLQSYYLRYGECGRSRMSLEDRLAFLNMGRLGHAYGMEGLFYTATNQNLTVQAANGGGTQMLSFSGSVPVAFFAKDRRVLADLTNPLLRSGADSLLNFIAATGDDQVNFTIAYNGISMEFKTKILVEALQRNRDKRF